MCSDKNHSPYRSSSSILLKGSGGNILIKNGIIISTDYTPIETEENQLVVDARDCLITPAFTDIHVHLREPGFSYKETILSGTQAAARGGYCCVCAMPNLSPAPDNPEHIAEQQAIIDRDAVIDVRPYATITQSRRGQKLVDFEALKPHCVAFSDDGSGVQDGQLMLEAMRRASAQGCIIAAHCEDESLLRGGYIHDGQYSHSHGHQGICSESEWGQIERDLKLCEQTGCRYHVCHISCRQSVDLIRDAKRRGLHVTCETAPHYLVLCEDEMCENGRFKMNPPLRSSEDRMALIEGLRDGTIDAIATDHAPHSEEEKSRGLRGSAMGIVGLETAFPVLYTHLVESGLVSLERLVEALSSSPRHIFGLTPYSLSPSSQANITIIDLNDTFTIDSSEFLSKGRSTPFEGMKVRGRVRMTIYNGQIVWTDGHLL